LLKSWRIRRIRTTNGAPTLTGVRPEASDTKGNCTILITYAGLELGQRRAHFLLQPGDEAVRIEWQPESSIVGSAFLHEVGGQVLVRVAVAVGADDEISFERNRSRSASSTQIS